MATSIPPNDGMLRNMLTLPSGSCRSPPLMRINNVATPITPTLAIPIQRLALASPVVAGGAPGP